MKKQNFNEMLTTNKVVGCAGVKVYIGRPSYQNDDIAWTLLVANSKISDVVVAWYKTRKDAREHAKILRQALKIPDLSTWKACRDQ